MPSSCRADAPCRRLCPPRAGVSNVKVSVVAGVLLASVRMGELSKPLRELCNAALRRGSTELRDDEQMD